MSNYLVDGADLTSVADAIRAKSGGSSQLAFPAGFVSEIGNIPSGGGGDEVIRQIICLGTGGLHGAAIGENVFFQSLIEAGEHSLADLTETKILVLPAIKKFGKFPVSDNDLLQKIDIGPSVTTNFEGWFFSADRVLSEIILRITSVRTLANINAFSLTPFASGGAGGTLYVPQSLISSYRSASNWSTILGYSQNSIVAIEGSYYETHYADGTLIS